MRLSIAPSSLSLAACLLAALLCVGGVQSFSVGSGIVGAAPRSSTHLRSTVEAETAPAAKEGLLQRDRYVATNRKSVTHSS